MADLHEDTNPFRDNDHEQQVESVNSPTLEEPVAEEPPVTPATPAAFRGYPGMAPKNGFCCIRDEYLHGDDAEIQVSPEWPSMDHVLTT